jgi:hypothetical protein
VLLVCAVVLGGLGLWSTLSAAPEERHPHIHRALMRLREAHKQLKEAKHVYGGHRAAAEKDVDRAINQLEKALRFANKR